MKRTMLLTALAASILFGCEQDMAPEPVPQEQSSVATNELGIDYKTLYADKYIDLGVEKTVDKALPDVVLPDLAGTEHDLSELVGQPMIIEFASTTCTYCQQMEPVMEKFKTDNPDVHVVQIYDLEDPEVVKSVMKDKSDGILRLVGEDAVMSETFESYYTPTMYYVDSEGVVRMLSVGTLTQEELEMNVAKTEAISQSE